MQLFYTSSRFLLFIIIISGFLLTLYSFFDMLRVDYSFYYLIPCILTVSIQFFCYYMMDRIGIGISEPIFILGAFLCFYTLSPAVQFFLGLDYIFLNSPYYFSNVEIMTHVSRLLLFQFLMVFFYFVFYDLHNTNLTRDTLNNDLLVLSSSKIPSLNLSFIIALTCIIILMSLSASVETYYDHYTRYDHLSTPLRKVVSVLKRIYWGIIPIIIIQIVIRYRNNVNIIFLFIIFICASDLIISKGSRINTFIIVLQVLVVYNCVLKRVKLKKVLLLGFTFIVFMSFLEIYRIAVDGSDLSNFNIIPGEFNSVFYPSIDLFKLRENETFINLNDLMIFKDLFFVIPFFNLTEADPMHWFWINYHPNAPVAPYTMGPIADSAFYGGWAGLIVRAFLLSLNITLIRLLLVRFRVTWVILTIYSFLVSVSILALKYSVLSYQEQFLKNLMPILIFIILINKVRFIKR